MDFGILLPFRNPPQWHRPITEVYDEHLQEAVLAEELGYDHVWTTEHHFYDDAWSPSLLPILSAIAQRTSRIRLGTFIIILPFHHPVRVAEDAATVDILSKGRLDLGVGQGYVVSEFDSFRIPRSQRGGRVEEGVELIRRCFTEENFSFDGKYYQMKNVNLTPKPVQKPYPPIWIAAMAEKSVARVAGWDITWPAVVASISSRCTTRACAATATTSRATTSRSCARSMSPRRASRLGTTPKSICTT